MALKGEIHSWNKAKGFGFILPELGKKPLFVHINDLKQGKRIPLVGEQVNYVVGFDNQNRRCATQVVFIGRTTDNDRGKLKSILIEFSILFLMTVVVSVLFFNLPVFILIIYVLMSLLTFFMYWLDKSAARKNKWRTKESTLQLMALIGGWPGAIWGQQLFRHKTKKATFQVAFWVVITINIGVFVWLHTKQAIPFITAVQNHINSLLM